MLFTLLTTALLLGRSVAEKGVFAHYLVTGVSPDQAATDIQEAKAAGLDAFALNVMSTEWWSTNAIQYLFDAAFTSNFKLFFSFDMTHFNDPSQFTNLLKEYADNHTYYTHNDAAMVSTFYGATLTFGEQAPGQGWQKHFTQSLGFPVHFVPSFVYGGSNTHSSTFFSDFQVDGVFPWDSAWPWESDTPQNVTSDLDNEYLQAAHSAGKTFMMSLSPLQFKHLGQGQNWFRGGSLNFPQRMQQILELQPDFVEIISWNDGGESHYLGKYWPQTVAPGANYTTYTDGFDHSGWQNLIKPFMAAYKASSGLDAVVSGSVTGSAWYRPQLKDCDCWNDQIGRPDGWQAAVDAVNVALAVPDSAVGGTIKVTSGGQQIAKETLSKGLNMWSFDGINFGDQQIDITGSDGSFIVSKTGDVQVQQSMKDGVCNFNFAVIGI